MFPGGMNPRQMKQMMNKMGIKTEEIDAKVVIITCADKDIVIEGPEVTKMNIQGQEMYSITGGKVREQATPSSEPEEEPAVEISDDDIKMVAEQAGVSQGAARAASLCGLSGRF